MNYALIIDESVQWFAYLVKYKEGLDNIPEVMEHFSLPCRIEDNNDFINNVYAREISFTNKYFKFVEHFDNFGGWYLSPREYNRIKRMIEIWPIVVEFNNLKRYE